MNKELDNMKVKEILNKVDKIHKELCPKCRGKVLRLLELDRELTLRETG